MSMLEELLTGVYSSLSAYPSSAPALDWKGPGVAPNNVTGPTLGWVVAAAYEDYAFGLGTGYYCSYDIRFTASSTDESPAEAVRVAEAVKTLFRSNALQMTLSTARILDIDCGITMTKEAEPGMNGWRVIFVLTFEVGT